MMDYAGGCRRAPAPIHHPAFIAHHLPFSRGAMPSYALSLLTLGLAVLTVWVWQFSPPQRARQSDDRGRVLARSRGRPQEAKIVGKITAQDGPFWISDRGTVERAGAASGVWMATQPSDVARLRGVGGRQWFEAKAVAGDPTEVPAGRAYFLHAGSLEVTYRSGTKLVLHGPAVFMAGEENGFVSYGWASVQVRRPKPTKTGLPGEDATSGSDQAGGPADSCAADLPGSGIPSAGEIAAYPQFTLRTGIAVLTSQGGDFEVAVDDLAASFTRVTRGRVALQFPGERPGEAKLVRTNRGAFVAYWVDRKSYYCTIAEPGAPRFYATRPAAKPPVAWENHPTSKHRPWNGENRTGSSPDS